MCHKIVGKIKGNDTSEYVCISPGESSFNMMTVDNMHLAIGWFKNIEFKPALNTSVLR